MIRDAAPLHPHRRLHAPVLDPAFRLAAVLDSGKVNRWGFVTGSPPRKVYYRDYVSTNTSEGPQA